MLKNLYQLEHAIENKVCRFICDNDTPINFIKEALFQMQKFIGFAEEQAKAQQEALNALKEPVAEESKAEPIQEV